VTLSPLPNSRSRSLLVYAGHDAPLSMLCALDPSVTSGVAKRLVHARAGSAFISQAAGAGLITVLPGEAWRNQLDPEDPQRQRLKPLGYMLDGSFDPSVSMSSVLAGDYSASFVDAQIAHGATLVGTPGHVHDAECGAGRLNDLQLAEAAIREWESRQAGAPRSDGRAAGIFATLMVRASALASDEIIDWLVANYLGLRVDGFWISVVNCGEGLGQLRGAVRLGLGLQSDGRFAVLSGVGHVHSAALARGLAATCAGHHGMKPRFPLEPMPDSDEGMGVAVYHPEILGCAPLGQRWAAAEHALFGIRPCACGHHPAGEAPVKGAKRRHNLAVLQDEARRAIAVAPDNAPRVFGPRVRTATTLRRQLKLGKVKPGWRGASSAPLWQGGEMAESA
jgi:hypothetical protein